MFVSYFVTLIITCQVKLEDFQIFLVILSVVEGSSGA